MTLRQALGGDTQRLHQQVEQLLDREDAVILLLDEDRAVNYIAGFGLSPSQHELLALEIERVLRAGGATEVGRRTSTASEDLDQAAQGDFSHDSARD